MASDHTQVSPDQGRTSLLQSTKLILYWGPCSTQQVLWLELAASLKVLYDYNHSYTSQTRCYKDLALGLNPAWHQPLHGNSTWQDFL